ncbi:MAG: phosphoribosylformylglycinamidine synthase subunit PurQ [Bdellovibrionales bacterium]|nr:phosphoribosylformylglycinamidine synthase subunit PurQ [Bdellovibrionales bacterium]
MLGVKALVVTGDGINCELETQKAFQACNAQADIKTINDILMAPELLSKYQILAFPGGFSYGDDLGSGKVMALKLEYSLKEHLTKFIEKGLVIGICNGFQILLQLGLLPDASEEQSFALAPNQSGHFQNQWVKMKVENNKCIWLNGLEGKEFLLPIRHGEGRLVCNNQIHLHHAIDTGMAGLRYIDDVNGSVQNIAGLCDNSGKVFGLMPHPECTIWEKQLPDRQGERVGRLIFSNAVKYFL